MRRSPSAGVSRPGSCSPVNSRPATKQWQHNDSTNGNKIAIGLEKHCGYHQSHQHCLLGQAVIGLPHAATGMPCCHQKRLVVVVTATVSTCWGSSAWTCGLSSCKRTSRTSTSSRRGTPSSPPRGKTEWCWRRRRGCGTGTKRSPRRRCVVWRRWRGFIFLSQTPRKQSYFSTDS